MDGNMDGGGDGFILYRNQESFRKFCSHTHVNIVTQSFCTVANGNEIVIVGIYNIQSS